MSQKGAPTYIRIKGKLYRKAGNALRAPTAAIRQAQTLVKTLDTATDIADNLFREIMSSSETGKTSSADLTSELIQLDMKMADIIPDHQRLVKMLVRSGVLDEQLVQEYLPWAMSYYRGPRSPESEERRQPVISKDITDWEQPPGESSNEEIYPYPLKNLHRSSVPHAIKVKGHIYRKI